MKGCFIIVYLVIIIAYGIIDQCICLMRRNCFAKESHVIHGGVEDVFYYPGIENKIRRIYHSHYILHILNKRIVEVVLKCRFNSIVSEFCEVGKDGFCLNVFCL